MLLDTDIAQWAQKPKSAQQPNGQYDDDDHIEEVFDFGIHWDIIVDEPKDNAHDNEGN